MASEWQATEQERERALVLAVEAVVDGLGYCEEFQACQHEPWRWNYERYHPLPESAVEAFRKAREARRLLGLFTPPVTP